MGSLGADQQRAVSLSSALLSGKQRCRKANLPLAQPESAGDTNTPGPGRARQRPSRAGVSPAAKQPRNWDTNLQRREPIQLWGPAGAEGSGSKLHSCWSTRASSSRLLPPSGTGAALRGEQQEGRERDSPFQWHLSAMRAAGLPS